MMLNGTLRLLSAAAATASWHRASQAFVGVQLVPRHRSTGASPPSKASSRPFSSPSPRKPVAHASPPRFVASMTTTSSSTTTSRSAAAMPPSIEQCSAETTFQGKHRVVHIATPAAPPPWVQAEDGDEDAGAAEERATIAQLVSYFGAVSVARGTELVKFGSVYIGEVVDTSWRHPPSKEKQLTVAAARKKAAKSAQQAPFRGTSFEHMKLRRLHPWESGMFPPHGSYLRVHCDPRMFPASQGTDWKKRIVHANADFVVLDKPGGVPTVPTIDNGVQNCLFQASLAVAGLAADSRSLPPRLHAVSRLDVCTSGIVVFARHKEAAKQLNELFRDRKVKKRYLALLTPGPPVPVGPVAHCCRSKAFDGSRRPRIYAGFDEELLAGEKWGGAWQDARSMVLLCAPASGAAAAAAVAGDRAEAEAAARALEESAAGAAARLEAELAVGLGLGAGFSPEEMQEAAEMAEGALADEGGEGRASSSDAEGAAAMVPGAAAAGGGDGEDGGDGHVPHLCAMELETGRTHQLRLQLAAMGAAIVGDTRYRGVVGRVHRGLRTDDDASKFGQEPEAIALQAARIEFEWRGATVVYSAERPSWALSDDNGASP
ncbi:unnamed protein product [Pylaiella littoralis]